ncbi:MAG: NAD(P)H-dependent oxidoreductase [Candidatus Gracilibacteria bacterium]
MHALLVIAHPSSKGFVRVLADAYKLKLEEAGHTVELLDLYKKESQEPYLSFEIPSETKADPEHLTPMQEKINNAQHLAFFHPLWWGGMPAPLKNFVDRNFASGFAFKYTKWGAQGLLKGKTGRVIVTGGGSPWKYLCIGMPFAVVWNLFILFYCGVWPRMFEYIGPKFGRVPEEKLQKWIRRIEKKAENEAKYWIRKAQRN